MSILVTNTQINIQHIPPNLPVQGYKAHFYNVVDAIRTIGSLALMITPIGWAALIVYKIWSHFHYQGLVEELGRNRFDVLYAALQKDGFISCESIATLENMLNGKPALQCDPSEMKPFLSAIYAIIKLMKSSSSKTHHVQKVRTELDKLLKTSIYQKNKHLEANPLIHFIHISSHALIARAEGMSAIEKHGRAATEKYIAYTRKHHLIQNIDHPSLRDLAYALDHAIYEYTGFEKDTLVGTLFWIAAHPQKTIVSLKGMTPEKALEYNSHAHGNTNTYIGHFQIGKTKMHFSLGPGPTGDRLFLAHLQYLKNLGNHQIHLQHTLESAQIPGEAQRRFQQFEIYKQNPETLALIASPLDGKPWKGTGEFESIDSSEVFHQRMKHLIQDPSKLPCHPKEQLFFMPEEMIEDDPQLLNALEASKSGFKQVENSFYWKALKDSGVEGRTRLNKVQLLGFNALLAVKAIVHVAKTSEKFDQALDVFMGQACKQGVDRGIIMHVMTRLYIDCLSGIPLTRKHIDQIVGTVLSRAGMIDDRRMLIDRFEALSDFLHILSENPEGFFQEMRKYFGEDISLLRSGFVSSSLKSC